MTASIIRAIWLISAEDKNGGGLNEIVLIFIVFRRLFRSTFPKARGIEAEMSCRRREGAGQSGSFAAVKAQGGCELQRKARRPAGARARKTKRLTGRRLSFTMAA